MHEVENTMISITTFSFLYNNCDIITFTATNATSCKDLKERHPELTSGLHHINVNGRMLEVYCDMETDGGNGF